jgi:hypothetical protein
VHISPCKYPNHIHNQRRSANGAYNAYEPSWPRLVLGLVRKKTCFHRNLGSGIPSLRLPWSFLRYVVSVGVE